jgi:acetylornithine deacetylase
MQLTIFLSAIKYQEITHTGADRYFSVFSKLSQKVGPMESKLLELLKELVAINSISSSLSGGPGEAALADHVYRYLKSLGIETEIQTVAPGRENVVGTIAGSRRDQSILLNAHLDTVGTDGMDAPFILKRQDDRLYGLGAYDMKGSVAIMLLLAEHFVRQPPPINILLTFVADEEDESLGMEYLADQWLPQLSQKPAAGLFLEPTEEQIGIAHKGFTWFDIEITGKAAHGSRPEEGIDAVLPLRAALGELERINSELRATHADSLLGHASLHGGVIEGGSALSVIPARSRLRWERRTLPAENQETVNLELKRVMQAVEGLPGGHKTDGKILFIRPPYKIDGSSDLIDRMQKASPGSKSVGMSFWADSALCGLAGIPAVLFGPIGHGAHAIDEWVSLSSLVRVYGVIKKLIEEWQ